MKFLVSVLEYSSKINVSLNLIAWITSLEQYLQKYKYHTLF